MVHVTCHMSHVRSTTSNMQEAIAPSLSRLSLTLTFFSLPSLFPSEVTGRFKRSTLDSLAHIPYTKIIKQSLSRLRSRQLIEIASRRLQKILSTQFIETHRNTSKHIETQNVANSIIIIITWRYLSAAVGSLSSRQYHLEIASKTHAQTASRRSKQKGVPFDSLATKTILI